MWYIITPWKRKCLGMVLPRQVLAHADIHTSEYRKVYHLKHAVVMWFKEEVAMSKIVLSNEFLSDLITGDNSPMMIKADELRVDFEGTDVRFYADGTHVATISGSMGEPGSTIILKDLDVYLQVRMGT